MPGPRMPESKNRPRHHPQLARALGFVGRAVRALGSRRRVVVALSGGYSRDEANAKLAANHGMIASFSRGLAEGLSAQQSDAEFNATLDQSIQSIYEASLT